MRKTDSAMTILQLQVCKQEKTELEPKWHPDNWRSWLVCAAGAISVVIVSGVAYSFGLLLPVLMENFQATRQQTGKTYGPFNSRPDHFISRASQCRVLVISFSERCKTAP